MAYKQFQRNLSSEFIDALNELYDQPSSWWKSVADDTDLYVAIRNGYLSVYLDGQSLLKVEYKRAPGGGKEVQCKIHKKYLLVPSEDDKRNYARLAKENQTISAANIRNLGDFIK